MRSGLPWFLRDHVRRLVAICVVEYRSVEEAHRQLGELARTDDLTPYGLRMLAALELERGDAAAARSLVDQAVRKAVDTLDSETDQILVAQIASEQGQYAEAIAAFTALITKLTKTRTPAPACLHGRAVAYARSGEVAKAIADLRACLAACDPFDAPQVCVDLADELARSGDGEGAIASLEKSGQEGDEEVRYALARLHAKAGHTAAAVSELAAAIARAREPHALRERAKLDEELASLRGDASFAATVAEPVVDTSWLDATPALAALRDHAGLRELGVRFVSEQDGRRGGDELRAYYAGTLHLGTLWVDALWEMSKEVVAPLTLIATGPEIPGPRHLGGVTHQVRLYVDLAAPTVVWIAPSSKFPAGLFTRIPARPDDVAAALRHLFLDPPRGVKDLPRTRRAVMGYLHNLVVPNPYSGGLDEAGPHELERHFNFSPAVDTLTWGSSFPDDPWPDLVPLGAWSVDMVRLGRTRRTQMRDAIARITRRTQFSRSHLGIEIHQPWSTRCYVWDIRYRPNLYPDTIERYNAVAGTQYPTDLPADVVAAIIGFEWMPLEMLTPILDGDDLGQSVAAWKLVAALRHGEIALGEQLRTWIANHAHVLDDERRIALAGLCLAYGWRALLEELALTTADGPARDWMIETLKGGHREESFNEMGEPDGLYVSDDEEEDE